MPTKKKASPAVPDEPLDTPVEEPVEEEPSEESPEPESEPERQPTTRRIDPNVYPDPENIQRAP